MHVVLGSNIALLQLKYCIISFDNIILTFYELYQYAIHRQAY